MKETGKKKERRSMTTKSKEFIGCILRHKWDTMSDYLNFAYRIAESLKNILCFTINAISTEFRNCVKVEVPVLGFSS